jgi:hypothetical protein
LPEERKDLGEEAEGLRQMVERLEGDVDDDEAVELLKNAVERVERLGKGLEEERR